MSSVERDGRPVAGPTSVPARHPDVADVLIGLACIVIGVALAASLVFLFIGAPLVMVGVELLLPRPS